MEVQTRNEEGALQFFNTLAEAMQHAQDDTTVWKVSWVDQTTQERVRLVNRIAIDDTGIPYACWIYEPLISLEDLTK